MLAPALGQHVLFLRIQQGKFADLREVTRKAAFADDRKRSCHTHVPFILGPPRFTPDNRHAKPASLLLLTHVGLSVSPMCGKIWAWESAITRRGPRVTDC